VPILFASMRSGIQHPARTLLLSSAGGVVVRKHSTPGAELLVATQGEALARSLAFVLVPLAAAARQRVRRRLHLYE
jgi:hypothetical protein